MMTRTIAAGCRGRIWLHVTNSIVATSVHVADATDMHPSRDVAEQQRDQGEGSDLGSMKNQASVGRTRVGGTQIRRWA